MEQQAAGGWIRGGEPPAGRDQVVLVYVTAPAPDVAETMGRELVKERLAACVNVVPGVTSFYWWEGRVQEEGEALLLVKTRFGLLDRLVARVRQLSGYQVPATSALAVVGGNPDYLRWVVEEARG